MTKITAKEYDILIEIFVKKNRKKDDLIVENNEIIVHIKDSTVKGKANKDIIQFLSKLFHISKNQITIISGLKSRTKRILLTDLSEDQKTRVLQSLEG